jgi:Tol biopolymer transport system component
MFFDIAQRDFVHAIEHSVIHAFAMHWSPDSQWLAFTGGQNEGLAVVNAQTWRVEQLVEPPTLAFPAWSPDSRQLAFAAEGKLFIWDVETQTTQEATHKDYVSEPAWSADGSLIAAVYLAEGESGIVIVNPDTQSEEMLRNGVRSGLVVWSPDGAWLAGVQNGFGLYVVDKDSGEVHLVLDTTGFLMPSSIMWLP